MFNGTVGVIARLMDDGIIIERPSSNVWIHFVKGNEQKDVILQNDTIVYRKFEKHLTKEYGGCNREIHTNDYGYYENITNDIDSGYG
ncbi:14197_t:CDS:2, partial [Entrophospora sp. SA101]